MDELSLVYYGYVFDASGYGQAARAYIHALHKARLRLSVVSLSSNGRQVRDDLVESLVGRPVDPDFHLFHGIPTQWARLAFRLPNAIGMTVWETDTMPSEWRNILNHTLEVWLPCEFNVSVFSRALERPVFKLPHPLIPIQGDGGNHCSGSNHRLGVDDADFVFYSIFEWQERKSPEGLIESFLRAFPDSGDAVLLIKTNPDAATLAMSALEEARRRMGSQARVEIRAEAWDQPRIDALHIRGDCYVSLHRGEGWGYPMFEAASRGKPVIATNYSGPLDYLEPSSHFLVRQRLCSVRQPYLYYNPGMSWAEPDLEHASELMRNVYGNRDEARDNARAAVDRLQSKYSLQSIGEMARRRLVELLEQTRPDKWEQLGARFALEIPISGDWYDHDYFETGLKSNWNQGYTWRVFSALFYETADFLTGAFLEASSYLDAGCAKGFLVRALRERGKECWGFDHSRWAINRAEDSIKSFVIQAGVDDVSFDRQFDVLVALSLLESLTPDQALSFLSRAHAWTRQALIATIPSFDSEEERRRPEIADRDLSHITMKPRRWWHELFLKAGWRQDAAHRIAQRALQKHHLPTRMGWKLYLYAT
jgi:2-polyprenyl-3-methyl-5-hydroxy-6-metoxy-1,4-benzoquinol methylase